MNRFQRTIMGMVLAGAVWGVTPCLGQEAPAIPGATRLPSAGEEDPGQYLGNVYKDEQGGFRIAPPLGSRLIERPSQNKMVVFVVDAKSWGGDLQRMVLDKPISLEDYARARAKTLEEKFKGVQVLERRLMKFQGYSALRLATSMEAPVEKTTAGNPSKAFPPSPPVVSATEMMSLYEQQLLVAVKDTEFIMLTFYSPLKDRAAATDTFNAMAGSLELMDPAQIQERRAKAVLLGRKWMAEQSAEILKGKLNTQPQLYRMIVGGKDVGYVQITEGPASQGGFEGVQTVMQSRTFSDSIILGQSTAFWAFKQQAKEGALPNYGSWDNTVKTLVNVTTGNPPRLTAKEFWLQITGTIHTEGDTRITEEDIQRLEAQREEQMRRNPSNPPPPITADLPRVHLVVTLDGDNSQHLKEGNIPGYDLPTNSPAFMSPILDYTWPRLVDLSKPSEMSFWVYNVTTRKLALRTLIVTGKKERTVVAGRQVDCWKCVDELDPGSTTLWVDSDGRPVSMRTSDQTVLTPTTEAEMKRKWAEQLKRLGS